MGKWVATASQKQALDCFSACWRREERRSTEGRWQQSVLARSKLQCNAKMLFEWHRAGSDPWDAVLMKRGEDKPYPVLSLSSGCPVSLDAEGCGWHRMLPRLPAPISFFCIPFSSPTSAAPAPHLAAVRLSWRFQSLPSLGLCLALAPNPPAHT